MLKPPIVAQWKTKPASLVSLLAKISERKQVRTTDITEMAAAMFGVRL